MSVNSSSYFNATPPPSPLPSMYSLVQYCMSSTAGFVSITAFAVTTILVLPLYIFVLYLGLQRWKQQRSVSHSDLFTYHCVVLELTSVFGFTLSYCGLYTEHGLMVVAGAYIFCLNIAGQNAFHVLTCVERYLAVVHPITYLSLKSTKGIRIRNITIGCVWMMSFAMMGFPTLIDRVRVLCICLLAFILAIVSFCSLSVLYVLIRPGPGDGVGSRQQIDRSKLKAFYTIMAILGVLLIRFGGNIFTTAQYSTQQGDDELCRLWFSGNWFYLPSSLVLPLLFLQRAGKLMCCKNNNT